jgi:hypothetical protein
MGERRRPAANHPTAQAIGLLVAVCVALIALAAMSTFGVW